MRISKSPHARLFSTALLVTFGVLLCSAKAQAALVSQIRGLLLDRGFAIPVSITRFRRLTPDIISDENNALSDMARETIAGLFEFLLDIDKRVTVFDRRIAAVFRANKDCQRIVKIGGVGPKTATAIVAAIGNDEEFKNGRHLAAWLGLVPRQHSSENRRVLMGISKRGDQSHRRRRKQECAHHLGNTAQQ